jgi:hypothetical protein
MLALVGRYEENAPTKEKWELLVWLHSPQATMQEVIEKPAWRVHGEL